jgi:hypothetical protein
MNLKVLYSAWSVLVIFGVAFGLHEASGALDPQQPSDVDHRTTQEPEKAALSEEPQADSSPGTELFERVSARHTDFALQVLPAVQQAAAPERADSFETPTDNQSPTQSEGPETNAGGSPMDRRPAIDPRSSLEGSTEPQL